MKPSLDTVFSLSICFYNLNVWFEYFKLFFLCAANVETKTVDKKDRRSSQKKIRMTFQKFVSEDNNEAPD